MENIKSSLKNKTYLETILKQLSKNKETIIIVTVLIIIGIILFIGYNSSLKSINNKVNKKVTRHYPKKLESLKSCGISKNYRLVDYYIFSSFNSASINGSNHYGYVSLDAVKNCLLLGARYLQLNIYSLSIDDNDSNAEPVVGLGLKNSRVMTSINSINFNDVIELISVYGFKTNSKEGLKELNYPLILDLYINTDNIHVMDKIFDYILKHLKDNLISVLKYHSYPIQLEYVCNLLKKCIIFVNTNSRFYRQSKLPKICLKKNNLINTISVNQFKFNSLTDDEINNYLLSLSKININSLYDNNSLLNNKLSELVSSNKSINELEKELSILTLNYDNNSNNNDNTNLSKLDIDNKLIFKNTIGFTIVEPDETETNAYAYDFRIPISSGCQFICMPLMDVENIYLRYYFSMFKESSFILKPLTIRIKESIELEDTILLNTGLLSNINDNPIKYNSLLNSYNILSLELREISSGNYRYLSISKLKLLFKESSSYFILRKQLIDDIHGYYILSPLNLNYCLTVLNPSSDDSEKELYFKEIDKQIKLEQLFILEDSKYESNEYIKNDELLISIRSCLINETPYYLSINKKSAVLRNDYSDNKLISFSTSYKEPILKVKITNLLYGPVQLFETGYSTANNKNKHSILYIIYKKNVSTTETIVNLKYNDNYLCNISDKLELMPDKICDFHLITDDNENYLLKLKNKILTVNNSSSVLEFIDDNDDLVGSEKYFSLDYILE